MDKNNIAPLFGEGKDEVIDTATILEALTPELLDDFFDIKPVLGALSLPEKEFALVNGIILFELEKQLNNSNEKLLMVQGLNAAGLKAEALTESFLELIEGVDREFTGKLSQQKIDFLKTFLGLFVEAISSTEGVAKRLVPLPFELIHKEAKLPTYAKIGDAGADIYAVEDITIHPGETVVVPTGLKVATPLGYELQVRPRSGLSLKTPLRIANSPGTIDSGYRDEVGVIVWNSDPKIKDIEFEYDEQGRTILRSIEHGQSYTITQGMRFAQLALSEVPTMAPYQVEKVQDIGEDRMGGFGSSGLS